MDKGGAKTERGYPGPTRGTKVSDNTIIRRRPTSFAVLCVPTILMNVTGCLSNAIVCHDRQASVVLFTTRDQFCWLLDTST